MYNAEMRAAEGHKILIVDDEPLIVLAMRRYFEGLGYSVDSAYELEEAQALLSSASRTTAAPTHSCTSRKP